VALTSNFSYRQLNSVLILVLSAVHRWTPLYSHSLDSLQSQNHIATDGQSVSLDVEPHLGLMTRYLLPFDSYGLLFCGAPSLTRGRVCLLYMLLALASAVFLGSESLGTCDHILLSQISDFPFRRLLWLAGSRWRYSTPPPCSCLAKSVSADHIENTIFKNACLFIRYPATDLLLLSTA
jgi:hypothetical protein